MRRSTEIEAGRGRQRFKKGYRPQTTAVTLAALTMALVLTGCQETPEVEVVRQKRHGRH